MLWRPLLCFVAIASAAWAEVDFNRDIRPLLVSHCAACHGGVKQAGGVSFVYPERVLPPEGWVVEPGEPENSVLIDRVTEQDPELRMPPPEHGPALSEQEIRLLREWISRGARWSKHWAFESPRVGEPPGEGGAWAHGDIDRYVIARLRAEGLEPSADASPGRWLRRASLDLIGLPPSTEELVDFEASAEAEGEAAYEAVVDRLLDSGHFGERWASVWLDQVRYADSKGMGHDRPRNAWKYRDWVIDAFNADLPYDRFTVMQIAGDLLPHPTADDLIATCAMRLSQSNEEGGTDDEEFRIKAVLERVNTTWQVWQGATFGCTQCHSHPYDPFRHEDYYRFAAFFNNTADADLDQEWPLFQAPVDPDDCEEAIRLDSEIHTLEEELWRAEQEVVQGQARWRNAFKVKAVSDNATRLRVAGVGHGPGGAREEYRTIGAVEKLAAITLEFSPPAGTRLVSALRVTAMPLDPVKAFTDSEWGFVWSHVTVEVVDQDGAAREVQVARLVGDEPHPLLDPQESLDSQTKWGFGAYTRVFRPRAAVLLMAAPIELTPGDRLRVRLEHEVVAVDTFGLVTKRGHVEISDSPGLVRLVNDPVLAERRRLLAALRERRSKIESVATPVMLERPGHLRRPQHLFVRGLFLDKAQEVGPGTPDSFPPIRIEGEIATRLDLARWLVSDDNPLTARVAANRFWSRMMGAGLVLTEEDFGSSGESPSHPELLDYLATRFRGELGWSVKGLLREIALSRTYRQDAKSDKGLYERDPRNRLYARGPRKRLPAEVVRDQALAAAGLLDRSQHGPPVRPPIPGGVWRPFDGSDKWPRTEPGDPARYRRSVYTYTKRSIPYPLFAAFDSPSREFCVSRRVVSNTPMQALEMLNSEAMVECAEALADRMRAASKDPAEQIAAGFQAALARRPTEPEMRTLLALSEESDQGDGMQAVASVLLNLDEFVTN